MTARRTCSSSKPTTRSTPSSDVSPRTSARCSERSTLHHRPRSIASGRDGTGPRRSVPRDDAVTGYPTVSRRTNASASGLRKRLPLQMKTRENRSKGARTPAASEHPGYRCRRCPRGRFRRERRRPRAPALASQRLDVPPLAAAEGETECDQREGNEDRCEQRDACERKRSLLLLDDGTGCLVRVRRRYLVSG